MSALEPTAEPGEHAARGRLGVLDLLRWVLLTLVLGAVAYALWRNWGEVSGELRRVPAGALLLALLCSVLAPVVTLLGWRALLADLGSPLHLAPAASMFFVGQLGKYVPGSVWSVVAQAEAGHRLGIPRRRTAVVGVLSIGLALHTGLLVGLPALPLLLDRDRPHLAAWPLVLVVPLLLLLWPRLLNLVVAQGLRLLRRAPLEHSLSGRAVVVTCGWFLLAWVSTGLAVWVLTRSLAAPADHLLVAAVCGTALASVAGMFSFLFPAGLGVRDGLLVLALGPTVGVPVAAAVVVLARFGTLVADLLCAGVGWSWARAHHLVGAREGGSGA